MATRTIARMYDSYADASAAIRGLEAAGFDHDDISLVSRNSGTESRADNDDSTTGSGAGTGATIGTLVGGGAGLLAGLGSLAIPGLGPVVAAGWLIAALTGAGVGAAAGGLLGGLTSAGVEEADAHVYAEGVRRGGTLVTVRTEETRAAEAERILAAHNPVDTAARRGEYTAGGWSRYDESAADGTPGNPPGTMLSRGVDQVAGTNISGAHPENEARPGMSAARDGTPGNPAGTMASRGLDQAAGTNVSGAYPGNETRRSAPGGVPDDGRIIPVQPDGAPGNPPGTKLSRGVDEVAGTNISGAHPENEDPTLRDPDDPRFRAPKR